MNKLIVMSVDAMVDEDMEMIEIRPNVGRLLERAARVRGGMPVAYTHLDVYKRQIITTRKVRIRMRRSKEFRP